MSTTTMEEPKISFPIVSFELFLYCNDEEQKECAQKLYNAFHNFGWIYLKDFGIPVETVDEMFAMSLLHPPNWASQSWQLSIPPPTPISKLSRIDKIKVVTSSLGVEIAPEDLDDWHSLLASNQASIEAVQAFAGRDDIGDRGCGVPTPQLPDYTSGLTQGVKGLKIGVLKEGFDFPVMDPRIRKQVLETAEKFSELGAQVIQISIPIHKHAADIITCAIKPCAARNGYLGTACGRRGLYLNSLVNKMSPLDQNKFDKMFSTSKFSLLSGMYMWQNHPLIYGKAMNFYRRLKDEYNEALETVDVLIMPTMPYVANRHAASNASPIEQMNKSKGCAVNTMCFNASGHPAMSIPVGMLSTLEDENAMLPVGMQITGKWFDEEMVYRVGSAWEFAFDSKNKASPRV